MENSNRYKQKRQRMPIRQFVLQEQRSLQFWFQYYYQYHHFSYVVLIDWFIHDGNHHGRVEISDNIFCISKINQRKIERECYSIVHYSSIPWCNNLNEIDQTMNCSSCFAHSLQLSFNEDTTFDVNCIDSKPSTGAPGKPTSTGLPFFGAGASVIGLSCLFSGELTWYPCKTNAKKPIKDTLHAQDSAKSDCEREWLRERMITEMRDWRFIRDWVMS